MNFKMAFKHVICSRERKEETKRDERMKAGREVNRRKEETKIKEMCRVTPLVSDESIAVLHRARAFFFPYIFLPNTYIPPERDNLLAVNNLL